MTKRIPKWQPITKKPKKNGHYKLLGIDENGETRETYAMYVAANEEWIYGLCCENVHFTHWRKLLISGVPRGRDPEGLLSKEVD